MSKTTEPSSITNDEKLDKSSGYIRVSDIQNKIGNNLTPKVIFVQPYTDRKFLDELDQNNKNPKSQKMYWVFGDDDVDKQQASSKDSNEQKKVRQYTGNQASALTGMTHEEYNKVAVGVVTTKYGNEDLGKSFQKSLEALYDQAAKDKDAIFIVPATFDEKGKLIGINIGTGIAAQSLEPESVKAMAKAMEDVFANIANGTRAPVPYVELKAREQSKELPKKVPEQQKREELAQDSFGFESTKTGPEIDPITQAIRDQVIAKQMQLFQDKMAELDPDDKHKIKEMDSAKFRDFLAGKEGKQLFDASLGDKEFGKKLNAVEVEGYKNVHQQFQTSFKNVAWDGPVTENVRTQKITGAEGQDLGTLKETTIPQKPPLTVKLEDGTSKTIDSYRKIDFPTKLDGPKLDSGPLHLSMAVKDEKGNNIAADKAVYFTAHYDKGGNLTEVSTPQPVKFMGEGKDAIGYIERDGQVFTLPVDRGRYETMMKEVAQNKGMGMNVSQTKPVEVAPDLVHTQTIDESVKTHPRTHNIDTSIIDKFKKEHGVEAFKSKAEDKDKEGLIDEIAKHPTMPPMHKQMMLNDIEQEAIKDGKIPSPTVKKALEGAQKEVGGQLVDSKAKNLQNVLSGNSAVHISSSPGTAEFRTAHTSEKFGAKGNEEEKMKFIKEIADSKLIGNDEKLLMLHKVNKNVGKDIGDGKNIEENKKIQAGIGKAKQEVEKAKSQGHTRQ